MSIVFIGATYSGCYMSYEQVVFLVMLIRIFKSTILVFLIACQAQFTFAETAVQTIALFDGKAMLSVNGKKAKIIKTGESYEGVRLISSNTDQAVIEVDGERQTLGLNSAIVLTDSLGTKVAPKETSQIWADANGFFRAPGSINGAPLEFLVDTGANLVVLSGDHADRIGLEYRDGVRTYAATASGTSPMYAIRLDQIAFDGLELNNINAGVIEGAFPIIPLLGMTFLSRVDMTRSGNMMELKKR
ncbi:MAG: TIGR02281 family clan AA aspartic protease [Acidiferrobacterales bacterium]|nr:TIGR02281 family clan AA aspartic protease [Acidiferrobacterales bacterium]